MNTQVQIKTQINTLRSGTKNQILNPEIDYSSLPDATSHVGHSGSNISDVDKVWAKVTAENPDSMKIVVKGIELELKANWSLSRKSVTYDGNITDEDLENKFFLKAAKNRKPSIHVQFGNIIVVSNGRNSYTHVCPSLIEIK